MWRIPAHRAAAQWHALQLEVEAMAAVGRIRMTRLRYEDFIANPEESLFAATLALGVPLGPGDLPRVTHGQVELSPSHGLSGNPARFRSGPVALRRDDTWTTQMPRADRAVVSALTFPLSRAYGYPTTTGPAPRTTAPESRFQTRSIP